MNDNAEEDPHSPLLHDVITPDDDRNQSTQNRANPIGAHLTDDPSEVPSVDVNDLNVAGTSETSSPISLHSSTPSQRTDNSEPLEQSGSLNTTNSDSCPSNPSTLPQDSNDTEQLCPASGSLPTLNHNQSQLTNEDNSSSTPSQSRAPDSQRSASVSSPTRSAQVSSRNDYQIDGASDSTENLMAPTQVTHSESHHNLILDCSSVLLPEPRPNTALSQNDYLRQEQTRSRICPLTKSEGSSSQTVPTSEAASEISLVRSSGSDYTPCSSLFGRPSQALPSPNPTLYSESQHSMAQSISTTNPLYNGTLSTKSANNSPRSVTTSHRAPQEHCQSGSVNSDTCTGHSSSDSAEIEQLYTTDHGSLPS